MAELFDPTKSVGGNGIFVEKGVIIDLQSNDDNNSQYKKDVDLKVTIQFSRNDTGEPYQKIFFLAGNLMGEKKNIPPHISFFLYNLGISEIGMEESKAITEALASNVVTNSLKDLAMGKEIKMLSYISGTYTKDGATKPSYKFWNGMQEGLRNLINPFDPNTSDEEVIKAFMKKVNSKYPPKYTPEILDESGESNSDSSEEI